MKETNFLITKCPENKDSKLHVNLQIEFKVADFGIASDFEGQSETLTTSRAGTRQYMA